MLHATKSYGHCTRPVKRGVQGGSQKRVVITSSRVAYFFLCDQNKVRFYASTFLKTTALR